MGFFIIQHFNALSLPTVYSIKNVLIKEENSYIGVDAVIDKDKSSCKLAIDLGVDTLLILTAVENVYINYNKERKFKEDNLSCMTS